MSVTPMWKYQKKPEPIPGPQLPRRTYIVSLAFGIGSALLFATAASIAPKGIPIESRALLLGFAAFYVLEFPGLLRWMATKRATGRKTRLPAIALPVFCLLSIFVVVATSSPRRDPRIPQRTPASSSSA